MWPFRKRAKTTASVSAQQESTQIRGVRVQLNDLIQARHHIRSLGLSGKTRSHALLVGGERSPFKGRGIDFEESRRYQPGDDVRLMDWRVTARTNEPHMKVFREERERRSLWWSMIAKRCISAQKWPLNRSWLHRLRLYWGGLRMPEEIEWAESCLLNPIMWN